jgi:hypothetical protein
MGLGRNAVGSLLGAAILFGSFGVGSALAAGPPAGPGDDAGTQALTTQATVDRAKDLSDQAAAKAAASAAAAAADPGNVDKAATAAADAAAAAVASENAGKEAKSLAGVNGGIASDAGKTPLPDVHFTANNAVKSDNLQWLGNSRGAAASATSTNANYAGATFIHYENLGYDFMLGDGTGGLSIFSLKNPENPVFSGLVPASALMQPADAHGPADTAPRFYEGENPTVDSRRKLAFLARDPRSFGNSGGVTNGRTGLYIIDVKDPWNPQVVTYHWVPAGHTATCINDCRYLWSVGPFNNGSHVAGQPQDVAGALHPEWTGVPAFVTDVRDINHPYTYAKPVDLKRNNGTTAYTHSVDVDQDGIAWTSGFGGIRGYYTTGLHNDPTTGAERYATATDPVPYAGGSVPSLESQAEYGTISVEHNSYHRTQAASDNSPKTITTAAGRTINKTDLSYVTQENVTTCTSTSGGGAGRFVTSSLAGSYDGKAWSPDRSATNRYFMEKLDDYTPRDLPGSVNGSSCSAHWFSVVGDMVGIGFYAQGTRILDVSDPTDIKQAGYFRVPVGSPASSQPATNTSAVYWHNGYIYTADYSRGIDVLRYTDPIKGVVQPLVCWNACDKSQTPPKVADVVTGGAGGTVGATLSLTLGTPAAFSAFKPGVSDDYTAQTTASVISTAGDGTLSVADPSSNQTGHLVNGTFALPSLLQAKASSAAGTGGAFANVGGSAAPTPLLTYSGPASNDAVSLSFQQHVGSTDALRTGTYSKTLTFTLSTTTP